jgi:UDP-glucose 4-epimerase
MTKKILVTGGAGFIGSHVIDRLVQENEVICLDNFDPYYDPVIKKRNIQHNLENKNFRLVEGDIRDAKLLKDLLEDVDYVIHEAAQAGVSPSVKNPRKTHEVNVTGTFNLLEAALHSDVKRIINASSSSVYGRVEYLPYDENHPTNPISPYGVSKLATEHYCKVFQELYGLNIVSLRYFTVYGPRMRPDLAIHIFSRRALRGEPIEIFGDGSKTRDFTYIDDVVDATLLAVERGEGIYNVGGGNRITIAQLAKKIINLTGSKSEIVYTESVRGDAEHTLADNTKAKRELEWEPKVGLNEGLTKLVNWIKENEKLFG